MFNIYYIAVIDHWRRNCNIAGIDARFKHGWKHVGDRTAKSCFETQFADDAAVHTTSQAAIQQSAKDFIDTARKLGLTVNIAKTIALVLVPTDDEDSTSLEAGPDQIVMAEHI